MKISQVIGMLQDTMEDCGDLEVVEHDREYNSYYPIYRCSKVYNKISDFETGEVIVACYLSSSGDPFNTEIAKS